MNKDFIPYERPVSHAQLSLVIVSYLLNVPQCSPAGDGITQQAVKYIVEQEISAKEYEHTLNWFYDQMGKTPLQLKATCAPHYYRILRQRAKKEGKTVTFKTHGLDAVTRGCLGGTGFCFISHKGIVQPALFRVGSDWLGMSS